MFKTVDISEKLKEKRDQKNSVLGTVNQWLWEEEKIEDNIFNVNNILGYKENLTLDGEHIFEENDIKSVCLDYNLRFLDKKYFKDDIPYEAIIKLKELKKDQNISFSSFKILAPSKKFKLKDEMDDPILFGQIGPKKYYMIHKWGNDLVWYKRLTAFPFRNIKSLITSILVVSMILGLLIPNSVLTNIEGANYLNVYRAITIFWCFIFSTSVVLYCWMVSKSNFSEYVWNSKYL